MERSSSTDSWIEQVKSQSQNKTETSILKPVLVKFRAVENHEENQDKNNENSDEMEDDQEQER